MLRPILTLAAALAAGLAPAAAEPFLALSGGCVLSSDRSNADELEFGSECGGLVALEAGYRLDLDPFGLELGLEAAHRWKPLHGRNGNGGRHSADGETLHMTSAVAELALVRETPWDLELYLGGGLGGARLDGLGDQTFAAAWQLEAGLRYRLDPAWSVGAGYKHFQLFDTDLAGNATDADFGGPFLQVRLTFGAPEAARDNHLDRLSYRSDYSALTGEAPRHD